MEKLINEPCLAISSVITYIKKLRKAYNEDRLSQKDLNYNINWINERYNKNIKLAS